MRFNQAGTSVTAAYTGEDGVIPDGVLDFRSRKLVGHWVEPRSARNCGVKRGGTTYWGRLEFTFSEDGASYDGVWGYCDEKPTPSVGPRPGSATDGRFGRLEPEHRFDV